MAPYNPGGSYLSSHWTRYVQLGPTWNQNQSPDSTFNVSSRTVANVGVGNNSTAEVAVTVGAAASELCSKQALSEANKKRVEKTTITIFTFSPQSDKMSLLYYRSLDFEKRKIKEGVTELRHRVIQVFALSISYSIIWVERLPCLRQLQGIRARSWQPKESHCAGSKIPVPVNKEVNLVEQPVQGGKLPVQGYRHERQSRRYSLRVWDSPTR